MSNLTIVDSVRFCAHIKLNTKQEDGYKAQAIDNGIFEPN